MRLASLVAEYLKPEDVNMQISPFKPLPSPTEKSWTSKPISTTSPTNSISSLESRVWNLPSPTTTKFQPSSHRIDNFSHLTRSFSVDPVGAYGAAVGMIAHSGRVDVLTTGPISVSTYTNVTGGESERIAYEVEDNVPFYLPTNPRPVMGGVGGTKFVFFPGGPFFCRLFEDGRLEYGAVPEPDERGGFAGMFSKQKGKQREDSGESWRVTACGEDKVACYQEKSGDVCCLDLKASECCWVELPEGSEIERVSASGRDDLFATLVDGTVVRIQEKGSKTKTEVRNVPEGMKGMQVLSSEYPPAHLSHDPSCRLLAGDEMAYATSLGSSLVGDDLYVTPREEVRAKRGPKEANTVGHLHYTHHSNSTLVSGL